MIPRAVSAADFLVHSADLLFFLPAGDFLLRFFMKDYIVKFELNDTTYELPFSADVNSSTVLKQCAEQWVEDYVNQTIKSGMEQWRILSVREDEK